MLKSCWPNQPFSLDHLTDLSDEPEIFLCVSERTLYVLQNAVIDRLVDQDAYSESITNGYYVPTRPDLDDYALYISVAQGLARDIVEVAQMPLYGIESAHLIQDLYDVPGAGNYSRLIGAVPEGELWELQALAAYATVASPSWIFFRLLSAAQSLHILQIVDPGISVPAPWQGRLVLSPGHAIYADFVGVAAGAALVSTAWYAKLGT